MRSITRFLFGTLALFIAQGQQALAFDTVVSDGSCRVEGLARPLRQTIIVLDEAAIEPFSAGKTSESNRRVNRAILGISGVLDGQTEVLTAPRERITVLFAREDGDLIRAFTGCPPVYSQEELKLLDNAGSGVAGQVLKFIGRDVRSNIEKEKVSFQSSLLQGMVELAKIRADRRLQNQGLDDLGYVQDLARATIDLSEGIPRVIVISPMNLPVIRMLTDVKSAREKGFEVASRVNADFRRAEVYLLAPGAPKYAPEFARALFLGMKGHLAAVGGEALPPFGQPPNSVRVFGGSIDYAGQKVPMQLRLSIDKSGSLVNSWIEVSVLQPVATPLTGKATCKDSDRCEVLGDGSGFSQSWVIDVKPNPTFNERLPFSGLRYFQLTTSEVGLKGRVYDPNAVISGGKKEITFELSATPTVKF